MQFSANIKTLVVAAMVATVSAHMNMASPPPLKYKGNPHAKTVDSDITAPNTAATFPCKGALDVFDTDEGASVATWAPGSQQTVKIEGGAAHNGGSCQMSLSYDKGATWTVIYSKIGNCPTDPNLSFTVPADTPTGDKVLLGWSWINHTGNREFYMNCASITIGGGKKRDVTRAKAQAQAAKRDTAYTARPPMFVANLPGKSNVCVKEGVDIDYPEPGPNVDKTSSTPGGPVDCTSGNPIAGGSGTSGTSGTSGSGSGSSAAGAGAGGAPATTAAAASAGGAGGSFITGTAAGAASPQSTLHTQTAAGAGAASHAPSSAAAAAPTHVATAAPAAGTGSAGGSTGGSAAGGTCSEGSWKCAGDGASFQRCAEGTWSTSMPMAAGTKCAPGVSDTLAMKQRRNLKV